MNKPLPSATDGLPFGGANSAGAEGWRMGAYGDGLPPQNLSPSPVAPKHDHAHAAEQNVGGYLAPSGPAPGKNRAATVKRNVSRVIQFEGPRGRSTRAAVWLRYFAFLFEILILSSITQALTNDIPRADGSGQWMLFACSIVITSGAFATMRHPNERNKIIREARHYILGVMVRPGVAIAAFIWASKGLFADAQGDAFAGLLTNALPIVFFCTVFLPALVFIKMVFGLGQLNRSMDDNQELVARYTRQDGYQR